MDNSGVDSGSGESEAAYLYEFLGRLVIMGN